jgi:CubicO group peptidase (beta-lactamase class C family)
MIRVKMLLAVLIISAGLQAQTSLYRDSIGGLAGKIDSYLLSAVEAYKFNGVALVAKGEDILFHKAYGWKNFISRTYNDTGTRFPILSITKSFTAMVILKLREQKKLALDDKLSKYLPDFPNGDKITVEHLITHTSGIYNFTDDIGEEDSALVNHPVARQQVLDILYNKPPAYAPGERFGYNNSGYYLAGIVIEKATGKSYEQNIRELIFDPLGIKNSGFDFNNLKEDVRATGYQFLNADQQKTYTYVDSTVSYSAGSIYSTSGDLYKWTRAIAKQQLLSSDSWDLAFTPKAGDYGIGFRLNKYFGRDYIKHSGGYPGFVSEFVWYPKDDVTIILLKNSGNYGQDIWPVTMGISSIVFGLPYDLWRPRTEVKLADHILRQKEGEYVTGELKIRFQVRGNVLYEILPDGTQFALLAENENSFYLENFNSQVRFVTNKKTGAQSVIIHEHGKDITLKKTK